MEILFSSFLFLIGLILGSFLNAWIYSLREEISIWGRRSMCPECKKAIAWYDNIPVLSFFLLRGICRSCKKTISWQYPIVELFMGIVFVFLGTFHHLDVLLIAKDGFIIFFLTLIFVYDLRYQQIPDIATIAPAVAVFVITLLIAPSS